MGDQLSPLSDEEVAEICKGKAPVDETKDFYLQHVMYRIKDPRKSLHFYVNILGMSLMQKRDLPDAQCSLYFVGYEKTDGAPTESGERNSWVINKRSGLIELTHNWGTENDAKQAYHSGNADPRGFGHMAIAVPDVDKACERFERLGVHFQKKPNEGRMRNLAFLLDPDGYWIEIVCNRS